MKNNNQGMTVIVKTITHLTAWIVFIYGVYIVLHGHIGPGGSFAGGVIVALSIIQIILAFGKNAVLSKISEPRILTVASFGAILFLLMNSLRASTTVMDIAGSLMVGAGLLLIFLTLVLLSGETKK